MGLCGHGALMGVNFGEGQEATTEFEVHGRRTSLDGEFASNEEESAGHRGSVEHKHPQGKGRSCRDPSAV